MGRALDFQGMTGLSLGCSLGGQARLSRLPTVHPYDEPARLSLGMVASQQSPLVFHLEADCNSGAMASRGKSLRPSYGVRVLKIP